MDFFDGGFIIVLRKMLIASVLTSTTPNHVETTPPLLHALKSTSKSLSTKKIFLM